MPKWIEARGPRAAALVLVLAFSLQRAVAVRPVELGSRHEAILHPSNSTEGKLHSASGAVGAAAEQASKKAHAVAEHLDTYHSAVHKMAEAISTVKDAALQLKTAYLTEFASGEDARIAPLMLDDHLSLHPTATTTLDQDVTLTTFPYGNEESATTPMPEEDDALDTESDKDIDYFSTADGHRFIARSIRHLRALKDKENKVDAAIEGIAQGTDSGRAEELPDLEAELDNITREENSVREAILHASSAVLSPEPEKEDIPSTVQEQKHMQELIDEEKEVEAKIDDMIMGSGVDNATHPETIAELEDERNVVIKEEDEVREEIMNASRTIPSTQPPMNEPVAPISTTSEQDTQIELQDELRDLKDKEEEVEAKIDDLIMESGADNATHPETIAELEDERMLIIKHEDEVRDEIVNISIHRTTTVVNEDIGSTSTTVARVKQDTQRERDGKLLQELKDEEQDVQDKIDSLVVDGANNQTEIEEIAELVDERGAIIKQEDEVREEMMAASWTVQLSTAPPMTQSIVHTSTSLQEEGEEAVHVVSDRTHMEDLMDEEKQVESKIDSIIEAPGSDDMKMEEILELEHQRHHLITEEEILNETIAEDSKTVLSTPSSTYHHHHMHTTVAVEVGTTASPIREEGLEVSEDVVMLHDLTDQEREIETELADIAEGPGDNATKIEELMDLEDQRHEILKEEADLREEIANASKASSSTTLVSPEAEASTTVKVEESPERQEDLVRLHELVDKEEEVASEIKALEDPHMNGTNNSEQIHALEIEREEVVKEERDLEERIQNSSSNEYDSSTTAASSPEEDLEESLEPHVNASHQNMNETLNVSHEMEELADATEHVLNKSRMQHVNTIHHGQPEKPMRPSQEIGTTKSPEVERNFSRHGRNATVGTFHHLQDHKKHVMKHELDSIAAAQEDAGKVREIDNMEEKLLAPDATNASNTGAVEHGVKELRQIHTEEQSIVNDAPIHATKGFSNSKAMQHQEEQQIHDMESTDIEQEDEVAENILNAEADEELQTLVTTSALDLDETTIPDEPDFDSE